MREVFTMWRNTRMIVLVSISAAAYVSVLLPFKGFVVIPGLTEVRPGAAIPVVLSFLVGPAAAWGAGFGNVIADALGGMLGPGSIFGFLGNFMYGYVPYVLWRAFMGYRNPVRSGIRGWALIALILLTNSLVIGSVVGWGVDLLGLAPFAALGLVIAVNNFIASASISTILLALLYERLHRWGLLYHQILGDGRTATMPGTTQELSGDEENPGPPPPRFARLAAFGLMAGGCIAFFTGLFASGHLLGTGYGAAAFAGHSAGSSLVALRMAPGLALLLVSAALL